MQYETPGSSGGTKVVKIKNLIYLIYKQCYNMCAYNTDHKSAKLYEKECTIQITSVEKVVKSKVAAKKLLQCWYVVTAVKFKVEAKKASQ